MSILGKAIGLLELIGFKYPVKHYMAQVDSTLWRGSRLSTADYATLKQKGVTLIVNLCAENDDDAVPANSLKHIRIPVIDNTVPTGTQVKEFLTAVTNNYGCVYVHCEEGKGRTGVFVACYRLAVNNWVLSETMKEAEKYGLYWNNQKQFIINFWKFGAAEWRRDNVVK